MKCYFVPKFLSCDLETEITALGIRCADHATPLYPKNVGTTPTSGGPSVATVCSQTKATDLLIPLVPKQPRRQFRPIILFSPLVLFSF
jgi:hypothetical protein